jgi:hypothetical protein
MDIFYKYGKYAFGKFHYSPLAHVKSERLKFVHKLNHFALKGKIYFLIYPD